MTYNWFRLINIDEFIALGIPSRELTLDLSGIGQKTILIVKGTNMGVVYEGVFLSVGLVGENPFEFEGYAVFQDDDNDLWLGVAVES